MSDGFDLIRDAYDVPGLDEHERAVLVRLAFMANEGKAWPSIAHLVDKLGKSERTIQRAIRRLVAAGHIDQRQRRHDTAVYTVHPVVDAARPVSATGVTATPVALTPVALTPVTDDAKTRPTDTLIAKNSQLSSKTMSSPKKRVREPVAIEIPDWVPVDPWNGWLEMRRTKGGKDTAYALTLAIGDLRKLADAGHPPGAVLDQSTLSRWTKLYPIKDNHDGLSQRNDNAGVRRVAGAGSGRPVDGFAAALREMQAGGRPDDHGGS